MKCVNLIQAESRYGLIDVAHGIWLRQNLWLEMYSPSPGVFKNWKIMDTQLPCTHFVINKDAAWPLRMALEGIQSKGFADMLKTFDGCFNIRPVRGEPGHVSTHSYALAIDLNAAENKLGQTSGGFYDHPDFVKCFTDNGWDWGGHFHGRKDPQHFSYAWEG